MLTLILVLLFCSLFLNGLTLWALYRDRNERVTGAQVTFNQLSAANHRLGALIAMQGYVLDDVERFAKKAVSPPEPEGAETHPKLDTEPTA
jgi:hypothetical protein